MSLTMQMLGALLKGSEQIEVIQTATGGATTGASETNSYVVTLSSAPLDGSFLVAVIAENDSGLPAITNIVQTGATWFKASDFEDNPNAVVEIWYAQNVTSAGTSITFNIDETAPATIAVQEYRGIIRSGSPVIASVGSGDGDGARMGVDPIAPELILQNNILYVGGYAVRRDDAAPYGTPDGSFTNRATVVSDTSSPSSVEVTCIYTDRIVNDGYSPGTSVSKSNTNAPWALSLVGFKGIDAVQKPGPPISVTQTASNNNSGSGNFNVTLGAAPADGSTLVAILGADTLLSTATQVVAGSLSQSGVTWRRVAAYHELDARQERVEIWVSDSVSSAGTSLSVTIAGSIGDCGAILMEIDGINSARKVTLVSTGYEEDNSATLSANTLTTLPGTSMVIAGFAAEQGSTVMTSGGDGFVLQEQINSGGTTGAFVNLGALTRTVESSTATDPSVNLSGSRNGCGLAIALSENAPTFEIIQATGAYDTSTSSLAVIIPNTPVNGNTLIMAVCMDDSSRLTSSISHTGATWTLVDRAISIGGSAAAVTELWYAQNVSGAGTTATLNLNGSTDGIAVNFIEVNGIATTGDPIEDSDTNTGSGSSLSTTSITNGTNANALAVAAVGIADGRGDFSSATNGYTITGVYSDDPDDLTITTAALVIKHLDATGSTSTGVTAGTSDNWATVIGIFNTP